MAQILATVAMKMLIIKNTQQNISEDFHFQLTVGNYRSVCTSITFTNLLIIIAISRTKETLPGENTECGSVHIFCFALH